ncbi:hypothetical protein M0812_21132 [Anaeramoeba flamelloides]|uniref:Uncharacterized protein n=1 Tax=Anaeramoeba flamelloides TaxID=1746091 RepID=A0AAV7YTQ7_9EUKA|nr:hypothetical protein M0812_21132 [Anaeramoeba flamelloides]
MHNIWKTPYFSQLGSRSKSTLGGYSSNIKLEIRTSTPNGTKLNQSLGFTPTDDSFEFSSQLSSSIQAAPYLRVSPSFTTNNTFLGITFESSKNFEFGLIGQSNPINGKGWCSFNQDVFTLSLAGDYESKLMKISSTTGTSGFTVGFVSEVELSTKCRSLAINHSKNNRMYEKISEFNFGFQYEFSQNLIFGGFLRNFTKQLDLFLSYQVDPTLSVAGTLSVPTWLSQIKKHEQKPDFAVGIHKKCFNKLDLRTKLVNFDKVLISCKYPFSESVWASVNTSINLKSLKKVETPQVGFKVGCDLSNFVNQQERKKKKCNKKCKLFYIF